MTKNQTTLELLSDRELVISRTFNGPPRIVFDAWTKAEFVRRWWAPKSHCVAVVACDADVRPGGKYRYVLGREGEEDFAFSGEYTEVSPHSRLVYTQVFEPMMQAGAVTVVVQFSDRDGKTDLVSHETYPSAEARDAAIASGMEHGMRDTMDQLDELVGEMAIARV